jgi:hypothetical protein
MEHAMPMIQFAKPHGQVFSVRVIGRTRTSRPAGYLSLEEAESAARALAAEGHAVIVYDGATKAILKRFSA